LGLLLLLLGFVLPPSDGIGVVVDASVFHESFLAGGIGKLLTLVSIKKFRKNCVCIHLWVYQNNLK